MDFSKSPWRDNLEINFDISWFNDISSKDPHVTFLASWHHLFLSL